MKTQGRFRICERILKGVRAWVLFAWVMVSVPIAVYAQDDTMEYSLYSCISKSIEGGGGTLDSLISRFEAELVSEGLLEDTGGEGYRGLLQRIASGQGIVRAPEQYFGPRYRSLEKDSTALGDCSRMLDSWKNNPGDSPLFQFEALREALLHENLDPAQEALAYLDVLNGQDLALYYYRLFTYELIDRQAFISSSPENAFTAYAPPDLLNTRGANVFRVYLNERNQLIVADQLVSPEQMLNLVTTHARTFEQSSLYIVEVEPDVKYNQFVLVKDQIALAVSQVRDTYSRVVLGKTLTELTASEQAAVFAKFPIRIISP